jgi:hypothetical protein
MMMDVDSVSSALPYCDAIVVDSEIRGLLELGPVRERLGFDRYVFSQSTLPALHAYLDEVEGQSPPEVVETAVGLYGKPEPYVTIFEQRN